MKHRILAAFLAVILFITAIPAAFAFEYTPEQQLSLLYEVDQIIREDGLESSEEDAPLERALKKKLRTIPTDEALLKKLAADPVLYEELLALMLSGYDAHTMYLPSGTYTAVFDPETNYVGVGVTIQAHKQGALVTDVNLKGPAFAAGIRMGDILTAADGQSLKGMDVSAISALLRGAAGTAVTVDVLRNGETLTLSLTRAALTQMNYSGAPLDEDVFYMKWSRIQDDGSYWMFRLQLAQMIREGYQCLILDLRDNPGGSLDLAFTMSTDLMEDKGSFFRIVGRDPLGREPLKTEYIIADGDGADVPHIYVLVNENSASASEIIAVSLRDKEDATLVGETTFGKGRAQQHYVLETDAGIVLTTMMLLPLEGEDYEGVGIAPDVAVENTLLKGDADFRVPDGTALSLWSCSDNGEALNRALFSLGLLEALPEKVYQVTEQTLGACDLLEALYFGRGGSDQVSCDTLRLVNYLLDLQAAGAYELDVQLLTAMDLAKQALNAQ